MKSFFKKIALVLVLAMVVTMLPANLRVASAADDDGPQMYSTLKFYLDGDKTGKYSDAARYAKTWNKDGYDVVGQFESSNPEVAKVNKKGLVTPLKVGTTTITATFKSTTGGEDVVRECVVTVKKNAVEAGISENSAKKLEEGIKVGESFLVKTYRTDADGVTVWKGKDVITSAARFTSSNTDVFKVTKTGGTVKGIAPGTATLKVWAVQSEGRQKDEDGNPGEYLPVTPVKEYPVTILPADPDVVTYDRAKLTVGNTKLTADGVSGTLVTFTLYSGPDMIDTETKDVQVRLESTYGTLAFTNVTLENGSATVLYTTPILTTEAIARITAIIVSAENTEAGNALINTQAAPVDIQLVPNVGAGTVLDENGATVLSSTVVMADRITLYFNKPVKAEDFMYWYGEKWNVTPPEGKVYKFVLNIDDNIPQTQDKMLAADFNRTDIINILQNTDTSLTFVLKDGVKHTGIDKVFTDNSKYSLTFEDHRYNNRQVNSPDVPGYVTDAILPSMLTVTQYQGSMTEVLVTFSEPMPMFKINQVVIDGIALMSNYNTPNKWGTPNIVDANGKVIQQRRATITRLDGTENETRSSFIIKLGRDSNGKQIYFAAGRHSLTINNVGDYAYATDPSNFISTATLDFNIIANEVVPTYTVEVQSPEQYLVQFNCEIEFDKDIEKVFKLQYSEPGKNDWKEVRGWKGQDYTVELLNKYNTTTPGKSQVLVEVAKDWTNVLGSDQKNYYNYDFRIVADEKTIINIANGKVNAKVEFNLNDDKMKNVDFLSPSFVGEVREVDQGTKFAVSLDEPIQFTKDGSTTVYGLAIGSGGVYGGNSGYITPSSAQGGENGKVPIITAQFVAKDGLSKTVDANIVDIDRQNYTLIIEVAGNKALDAGKEYTLYVRSVSDDIGNTSSTLVKDFTTMAGAPVTPVQFQIAGVWADAKLDSTGIYNLNQVIPNDTDLALDAIYVEFTKDFAKAGGVKTVLTTTNWTINGYPLPAGSYIVGNIIGDSRLTGVTIVLPHGTITNINATVVTLSNSVEDVDGKPLSSLNRVVTQYPTFGFDKDGNLITLYSAGENKHLHGENSPYLGKIGLFAAKYQDNKIEFTVATGSDKVDVTYYVEEKDDGSEVKVTSGAAVNVKISISDTDKGDAFLEDVFVGKDKANPYESIIDKYVLRLYGVKDGERKVLLQEKEIKFADRASLAKGVIFDDFREIKENFKVDKDGNPPYKEFQVELQAVARHGESSYFSFSSNTVTYDKVNKNIVEAPKK